MQLECRVYLLELAEKLHEADRISEPTERDQAPITHSGTMLRDHGVGSCSEPTKRDHAPSLQGGIMF